MTDQRELIGPLEQRFGIPGAVRFDTGRGGLARARLQSGDGRGEVYLHGGHVTAYEPRDERIGRDVMFLGENSAFAPGEPIRGGVPICFPWFADHGEPKHGPVRLQRWEVTDTAADDAKAQIVLATDHEPFRITCRVIVGTTLELRVCIENTHDAEATFELALHTYFAIADITRIEIAGLEGREYLDKTRDMNAFTQEGPIRFEGEVDRVYQYTGDTCTIRDPGYGRAIAIEKTNLHSTIVWNPWQEKNDAQSDLAKDAWRRFVCVESGNVHANADTLASGATHECAMRITAAPL